MPGSQPLVSDPQQLLGGLPDVHRLSSDYLDY